VALAQDKRREPIFGVLLWQSPQSQVAVVATRCKEPRLQGAGIQRIFRVRDVVLRNQLEGAGLVLVVLFDPELVAPKKSAEARHEKTLLAKRDTGAELHAGVELP
jgi:hypothetical protein